MLQGTMKKRKSSMGDGINVDEILTELERIKISIHCWQGDDVRGFLFRDQELSGASP